MMMSPEWAFVLVSAGALPLRHVEHGPRNRAGGRAAIQRSRLGAGESPGKPGMAATSPMNARSDL
jgi:hypothetical protein